MENPPPVVCHLTSVHPSDDPRIFQKECCTLARAGYQVILVAPHEGPPMRDGVAVVAMRRFRRYFPRWIFSLPKVFGAARRQRASIYHLHDPELIPLGLLLRLCTRGRVVYDMHEYYSEYLPARGGLVRTRCLARWFCQLLLEYLPGKLFDAVVFPTDALRREFPKLRRATTLRNLPQFGWSEEANDVGDAEREYDVVFVGAISEPRFRFMMSVLVKLAERRPTLKWLFVGFDQQFQDWIRQHFDAQLLDSHVRVMPRVPFGTVLELLQKSKVGFNYHPSQKHLVVAIPMKVFEYMAAGLPVVSTGLPELRSLLIDGKHAILLDSDDPDCYAEAVASLLDNDQRRRSIGQAGRQYVNAELSWETHEAPKLLELYHTLLGEHTCDQEADR